MILVAPMKTQCTQDPSTNLTITHISKNATLKILFAWNLPHNLRKEQEEFEMFFRKNGHLVRIVKDKIKNYTKGSVYQAIVEHDLMWEGTTQSFVISFHNLGIKSQM